MNKKEHLEVQKIYTYQHMSAAELNEVFEKLGVKDGARLFYLLLKSFGLAARVANAAWGFYKEWKSSSSNVTVEEEKLAEALHDYAPDHFGVTNGQLEFAAQCFEEFYNEASGMHTKEEVEELLFAWTSKLHKEVAAANAKAPVSSPKAKKRSPVTS